MDDVLHGEVVPTTSTSLLTLKNQELKEHAKAIKALSAEIKKDMFAICVHFLYIADRKLYLEDGFENLAEFSYNVLGYSESTVYRMVKLARSFLVPSNDGGYHSILQREDGLDYNLGQLQEMLVFPVDYIQGLDNIGYISPYMSAKDIRAKMKEKREEKGIRTRKPRGKTERAKTVKEAVAQVSNVDMCVQRILESIPVVVTSDKYKDNFILCEALNNALEVLEVEC